MWMYEQLQSLYSIIVSSDNNMINPRKQEKEYADTVNPCFLFQDKQDNEVEIDLDELLDLENDSKRKEHLKVIERIKVNAKNCKPKVKAVIKLGQLGVSCKQNFLN